MSCIRFQNVSKSFGENRVIPQFELEIPAGKLTVLLGPSGCGKSTLLRLISGLETPDSGKIFIGDKDVTSSQPKNRKVAMVFQNYALYPHLTVMENLMFPLKIARLPAQEIKVRVEEVADLLGLTKMLDRLPKTLSGGERQRTAVGRALVRKPRVFLFDEPLSNLDFQLRNHMRQELIALQQRLRQTMVYVTHDQTEGMTMADLLVVVQQGKIMQAGTPEEIYRCPQNLFTANFVGQPQMNLFAGRVVAGKLYANGNAQPICQVTMANGEYQVGIRPEHISVCAAGGLKYDVEFTEFQGSAVFYSGHTGSLKLQLLKHNADRKQEPRQLNVEINPTQLHFFDPASGSRIE